MTVEVSCVVVAYHRPREVGGLVAGLVADGLDVVVVNVEDDASVADAATGAALVPLTGNPGFGAAVNAGARAARGKVLILLNDDVEASADVLRALAAVEADVAIPALVDETGRLEPTIFALPSPARLLVEWAATPDRPPRVLRRLPLEKWRRPGAVEAVHAAAATVVAVRRDLLLRVPMPEQYFLYWEEAEWFWRLREAGATVVYVPRLRCRHRGGRADVRPAKSALLARNAVRCVRRTQGRSPAAVALPVVVAWNVRLLVVDAVRALVGRAGPGVVAARVAGTRAALGAWREVW